MDDDANPAASARTVWWIIWGALAVSQVIYVVVPGLVSPEPRDNASDPIFPIVLGVVAAAQAGGLWMWFQIGAVRKIRDGRLDPDTPSGLASLFTTLILAWVLAESIGIYGFLLHFLGAPSGAWAPFSVLAGLMLFLCRPGQAALRPPRSSASLASRGDPIE